MLTVDNIKRSKDDPECRQRVIESFLPFAEIEAHAAHKRLSRPFNAFPETLSDFVSHSWDTLSAFSENPREGVAPIAHLRRRLRFDANRILLGSSNKKHEAMPDERLDQFSRKWKGDDSHDIREAVRSAFRDTHKSRYEERFLVLMLQEKRSEADTGKKASVRRCSDRAKIPFNRAKKLWASYKSKLAHYLSKEVT